MNAGQTTDPPRRYGGNSQAPDLTELPRWYLGLIIAPVRTIQEFVRRQAKWVGLVTLLIVAIVNLIVVIALGVRSLWLGSVDGVDAGTISLLILGELIGITLWWPCSSSWHCWHTAFPGCSEARGRFSACCPG